MEPATRGRTHTSSTVSLGAIYRICCSLLGVIKSSIPPPKKKVKHEDASGRPLPAPTDSTLGCISAAEQQNVQSRRVDDQGYVIEAVKQRCEYTHRDLPVPCDQRWSRSFISTAILWYSVQNNIWNVPDEELAFALQCIFNVVYPGTKYRVTPAGSVFAVVSRFPCLL